jgi:type I restriction enzyme M protein
MLFIDARKLGTLVERTRRELSDLEIKRIADTYHAWRGEPIATVYADIPGFCKSVSLGEVATQGHVLTVDRYLDVMDAAEDGEAFNEKMQRIAAVWRDQQAEARLLDDAIDANLKGIGYAS